MANSLGGGRIVENRELIHRSRGRSTACVVVTARDGRRDTMPKDKGRAAQGTAYSGPETPSAVPEMSKQP